MNGKGQVKILCAWHPQYFGREHVIRDGDESSGISHGICHACMVRALGEENTDEGEP